MGHYIENIVISLGVRKLQNRNRKLQSANHCAVVQTRAMRAKKQTTETGEDYNNTTIAGLDIGPARAAENP